jgi:hypothetical protein
MTIYSHSKNHRKIYENYYGPIPKDREGRTYEIHHIDGNHSNNDISNLKAVTIQEHYNIHYSQGDWAACFLMAKRMKLSPEETSALSSLTQRRRVREGTHHFLGGKISKEINSKRKADGSLREVGIRSAKKRVEEMTHNFQGPAANQKRIENGTHNFLSSDFQKNIQKKRVEAGTHHLQGPENNKRMMEHGTHPFIKKWKCAHCGKEGRGTGNYTRLHGQNCKLYKSSNHSLI